MLNLFNWWEKSKFVKEKKGKEGRKKKKEKKEGNNVPDEALTSKVLISGILKPIAAPPPVSTYTPPFDFLKLPHSLTSPPLKKISPTEE